jgi:hypothetical protein
MSTPTPDRSEQQPPTNAIPYRHASEPRPVERELTHVDRIQAFAIHRLGLIGRDGMSKSGSPELPDSNLLLQFNFDTG